LQFFCFAFARFWYSRKPLDALFLTMDNYTDQTKLVLENRFEQTLNGIYFAHQPIYGYRSKYSSGSAIARYMITRSILSTINRYSFETFVDIGGAEGYTAFLVKKLFGGQVMTTDLSENACKMATEIFNIPATPCDIHQLPFKDQQFDIVLCSETLEHVTDYKLAIEELLRITKKLLIVTVPHESPELVAANIRNQIPHGHIHYFDTHTLDYLTERGHVVKAEKTMSPFLVIPRVIAEGQPKNKTGFLFRLYNWCTPVFRLLFGVHSARRLTDMDPWFCKRFKKYAGLTFAVEKNGSIAKKETERQISAKDFIFEKVDWYRPK
jgi:ubiquinone/menaquinone biosynthesis C-methylase UbiE